MCGCERHHDPEAECTCICPEHGNFAAAYELATSRYTRIRQLEVENAQLRAQVERLTGNGPGNVHG